MIISPRNIFYKWAYICEEPPSRTDLCTMFWRCVGKALLALTAAAFVVMLIIQSFRFPWAALTVVLGIVGLFVVALAIGGISAGIEAITSSEAWQFVKGNYCPQVSVRTPDADLTEDYYDDIA